MSRMDSYHIKNELTGPVLDRLVGSLSEFTSVNFRYYKKSYIQRRINRQLIKHNLNSSDELIHKFQNGEPLSRELISHLTVHVTRFFRDPSLFTLLMEEVYPRLWKQHLLASAGEFRIWIIGCSTGEEAYSAAIAFLESIRPDLSSHPTRIFATDLDEIVIEQARKGEYDRPLLDGLSQELRDKYFIPGDTYRVIPKLRRLITFGQHDLLKDPCIHHLDIVFCRNVLIFLNRKAQDHVCQRLYESLNKGGVLVLGNAESPTRRFCNKAFIPLCRQNRIYHKV